MATTAIRTHTFVSQEHVMGMSSVKDMTIYVMQTMTIVSSVVVIVVLTMDAVKVHFEPISNNFKYFIHRLS